MLQFSPEEMEKELAITILDDSTMEGLEHFFVGLTLPMNTSGVVLGATEMRIDIEDNDGKLFVCISMLDVEFSFSLNHPDFSYSSSSPSLPHSLTHTLTPNHPNQQRKN